MTEIVKDVPRLNFQDFVNLDQLRKPDREEPERDVKGQKPKEEPEVDTDDGDEVDEDIDQDEGDDIDETERESFEENDEEEDEEDEETKAKPSKDEIKRRGFQAENAKLKAKNDDLEKKLNLQTQQINMLMAQMSQQPARQQRQAEPDMVDELESLLSGDPDDYPTNATIKKILGGMKKATAPQQANNTSISPQTLAWMVSQPDYQEINEYANKYNLATDPYFMGIQTDAIGAFFGIRAKLAEEKAKKLEANAKRIAKTAKRTKGKIPRTGSSGPISKTPKRKDVSQWKMDFWTGKS